MRDYNLLLLVNGGVKVLIWAVGAALAVYRRRALVAIGFSLFSAIATVRAFDDADVQRAAHVGVVALGATPAAGMVVASFLFHQSLRSPRPTHWTP